MTEKKIITLNDLIGEHWLDAVDFNNPTVSKRQRGRYDDANSLTFRLNNVCYTVTEDPDDGYRSTMNEIFTKQVEMKNVFNPTWVLARKAVRDLNADAEPDVVEFVDLWNGEVILSVGTDHNDDYYPSFVSYWAPERMACNQ